MARLFSCGAELNSLTANVEVGSTAGAGMSITSTTVRSGTYAYRCSGLSSGVSSLIQFNISAAIDVSYTRAYFLVATLPSATNRILRLDDASNNNRVALTIDNSGVLKIVGSSTTTIATLSTNRWYCLEIKVDRTGGAGATIVKCRVDGGTEVGSTTDTLSSGVGRLRIGGNLSATPESQTAGDWFFDDLAFNDSTGTFQKSYPGSGKIIHLKPNNTGDATQWTKGGSAVAATNWQGVNEVTPDDSVTLNKDKTLNNTDMFSVADSGIGSRDTVNLVAVGARFNNDISDTTAAFKLQIEKTGSGAKTQSAAIVPNSTTWRSNNSSGNPIPHALITYQDPDSANWTQSTLDSMQIGYITTLAHTNNCQVSTIWTLVEYIPAPSGFFNFF
jgi:hypothetical protein